MGVVSLCKCGHVEAGHVVVRPHVDPPAPYRGFCIIAESCPCQKYTASGSSEPDAVRTSKTLSNIEKMLADAAAAVKRPTRNDAGSGEAGTEGVRAESKSTRELLEEAAPDAGE